MYIQAGPNAASVYLRSVNFQINHHHLLNIDTAGTYRLIIGLQLFKTNYNVSTDI